MLGTLDDLKAKQEITGTASDAILLVTLEAASDRILDLTRFSETAEAGRVDTFRRAQYGRELRLSRRAVSGTPTFEGRALGTSDWSSLTGDVLDADEGVVILLGAGAWWPPTATLRPRFARWRNPVWPLVRVTYDVTGVGTGANAPEDLQDAALALAAYWHQRHLAGADSDQQAGTVRRTLMDKPVPAWVTAAIEKHLDGARARWV